RRPERARGYGKTGSQYDSGQIHVARGIDRNGAQIYAGGGTAEVSRIQQFGGVGVDLRHKSYEAAGRWTSALQRARRDREIGGVGDAAHVDVAIGIEC